MTPVITGASRGTTGELEAAYFRMVKLKAANVGPAPTCKKCGGGKRLTQRGNDRPYFYCPRCISLRLKEINRRKHGRAKA